MPRQKMWVSWEDGADLSRSRKSPGDLSPLTRDVDKNLGQVVLQPIEDDEAAEQVSAVDSEPVYIYIERGDDAAGSRDATTEEMWGALLLLWVVVALERGPEIKHWWVEHAQPALSRVSQRRWRSRRGSGRAAGQSQTPVLGVAVTDGDVSAALEGYRVSMSSDEARDRLVAALMARSLAEEQLTILRNARIDDPTGNPGAANPLEAVSPKELEAGLRMLLEKDPSLVESNSLGQIGVSLDADVVITRPDRTRALVGRARRVARMSRPDRSGVRAR